jgi:hypothetical protein
VTNPIISYVTDEVLLEKICTMDGFMNYIVLGEVRVNDELWFSSISTRFHMS